MECESVVEECPRGVPEKRRGSGERESGEKDRTVVRDEGEAGAGGRGGRGWVGNGVGSGQRCMPGQRSWARRSWDKSREDWVAWQRRRRVRSAVAAPRRVIAGKAAAEWSVAGWRGNRSCGCERNLWGAGAAGNGTRTHPAIRSSVSVHCW